MMPQVKVELVPEWKLALRYWSVRLQVIGAAFIAYLLAVPDAALQLWAILPESLKTLLPTQITRIITLVIFVLGIFARVIRQPKVERLHEQKQAEKQAEAETGDDDARPPDLQN